MLFIYNLNHQFCDDEIMVRFSIWQDLCFHPHDFEKKKINKKKRKKTRLSFKFQLLLPSAVGNI